MTVAHLVVTLQVLLLVPTFADEPAAQRWEPTIRELEAKLDKQVAEKHATLFIGSSSIRLWNLNQAFPNLTTVNHGFGGSETSDSVHYFDRLVTPVRPDRIVMYAGDNDIAKKKSPEQVHADFREFTQRVRAALPEGTPIFYIAIKPSISRWKLREPMQRANQLIRQTCESDPTLHFIDIWTPMLGDDGKPRPELFVEDGLHLNAQGYALWNRVLQESFAQAASETTPQQ